MWLDSLDGLIRSIRVRGVDTKLHSMGISVGQLPVAQLQFEQLERNNNWRVQEQQEQQEEQEKQEQEWGAIG